MLESQYFRTRFGNLFFFPSVHFYTFEDWPYSCVCMKVMYWYFTGNVPVIGKGICQENAEGTDGFLASLNK